MAMANLPSAQSLHEFRTAIAIARAVHNGNKGEAELLTQIIEKPELHVAAMRSLIGCLLIELDTSKRDANDVLTHLVESAAMQETRG